MLLSSRRWEMGGRAQGSVDWPVLIPVNWVLQ